MIYPSTETKDVKRKDTKPTDKMSMAMLKVISFINKHMMDSYTGKVEIGLVFDMNCGGITAAQVNYKFVEKI